MLSFSCVSLCFSQRLKDQYLQSLYAELADSSKLCLYKDYKSYYEHETYLNSLNIRTFRHILSKFRSGCYNSRIEVGRHHGLPRRDRLCRLCKDEVENDNHFIISMPCIEPKVSSTKKLYFRM